MNQLNSLESIVSLIGTGQPILVYFSGENCSVCSVLKPKVEQDIQEEFPLVKQVEVKCEENPLIASHFTVFTIPTILFFLDSKEFQRVGRNISVHAFIGDIKRPYEFFCEE